MKETIKACLLWDSRPRSTNVQFNDSKYHLSHYVVIRVPYTTKTLGMGVSMKYFDVFLSGDTRKRNFGVAGFRFKNNCNA